MTGAGGNYSAQIPIKSAGTIVQFYVEATDALGATASIPAGGAAGRALYIVDDAAPSPLSAHELRVVMLPADSTSLLATLPAAQRTGMAIGAVNGISDSAIEYVDAGSPASANTDR